MLYPILDDHVRDVFRKAIVRKEPSPVNPAQWSWSLVASDQDWQIALDELSKHRVLGLDTETTGLSPYKDDLVLVQIATPFECFLFPARPWSGDPEATPQDPAPMPIDPRFKGLAPILGSFEVTKIIQYAPFDCGFIYKHLGVWVNNVYDTRYMESLIPSGLKKGRGLKNLAQKYLGLDLSKEEQTSFKLGVPFTPSQLQYAAYDALVLFPIALGQGMARGGEVRRDVYLSQTKEAIEHGLPLPNGR